MAKVYEIFNSKKIKIKTKVYKEPDYLIPTATTKIKNLNVENIIDEEKKKSLILRDLNKHEEK